jgi:hypothetical protein
VATINPSDNTNTSLDLDDSGFAVGAFNADPVINPLGLPNPLPSKTFGEAAVNFRHHRQGFPVLRGGWGFTARLAAEKLPKARIAFRSLTAGG